MHYFEIAGAPGSGKSTIADPLWGPRAVRWDGGGYPEDWKPFLDVLDRLMRRIAGHPSYRPCESMVRRALKKIATVSRMPGDGVYVQTGLVQRGLGIGWRLGKDVEAIADYFETVPLSLGVAFLSAPVGEIQRRNVARGKDRGWMVPLMERPREIGIAVLRARGVEVLDLDATEPADDNRNRLVAAAQAALRRPPRPDCEVADVLRHA